ncbi:MAG TPA: serine O-acetyltransferase [Hypericibacter adhaerens]|uniref:Serine acetyltransferase n=1 Tax=Hypericibacter adhaerens TaxID=2602016 RepID=A0A5J6MWN4_9PROT|nr:serine O-acetyltransferase [Hypericibacter adhaerens]QEX21527.1 serine acetyltransferase [Hypericibacter adhaerens]HWA45567.1 serine O-acetyltransferase [Hypericibacter adhaerens]
MFQSVKDELDSIIARDPAARSRIEVALTYPGFHAVMFHRMSHAVWIRGWRFLGRFLSQMGRLFTGIEIHPGATVGRRLFIDHGMGTVVGETAEIGDDVTMYHGVTLGGVSPSINSAAQVNHKRHPTIRNGAIIGSGAQVLGPITVGERARVGANAVVVKDVPPNVAVVGIPAKPVTREVSPDFMAYGTPTHDHPDPAARAIEALMEQVTALKTRVEELEKREEQRDVVATLPLAGVERSPATEGGAEIQPLRRRVES